jgi:hypothetical protein
MISIAFLFLILTEATLAQYNNYIQSKSIQFLTNGNLQNCTIETNNNFMGALYEEARQSCILFKINDNGNDQNGLALTVYLYIKNSGEHVNELPAIFKQYYKYENTQLPNEFRISKKNDNIDLETCLDECQMNTNNDVGVSECKGVSYNKMEKRCYYNAKIVGQPEKYKKHNRDDFDSYIKKKYLDVRYDMLDETFIVDHYQATNVKDITECLDQCNNEKNCKGFSLVDLEIATTCYKNGRMVYNKNSHEFQKNSVSFIKKQ